MSRKSQNWLHAFILSVTHGYWPAPICLLWLCVKWHTGRSVVNDTHASLCPFCTPQKSASHFLWKWLPSTLAVCSAAVNQTFYCQWVQIYKVVCAAGSNCKSISVLFLIERDSKVSSTSMSKWFPSLITAAASCISLQLVQQLKTIFRMHFPHVLPN